MRTIEIYRNGILAGTLTEENRKQYVFEYDDNYFNDPNMPSISLTLPKTQREYRSSFLFPFFFNMLSEGVNRKLQSTHLKIDENDNFSLLAATAQYDTIGAITVKAMDNGQWIMGNG
jgi:serine/threonine-protein kinase HipA